MKRMSLVVAVALACAYWSVGAAAQTVISADGVIESTSGGFKFPDGTVQTSAVVGGPVPVEDTGVTGCWDADEIPRACVGTGEDGELQAGVAWPSPRFTDNGDGTVTDNLTGLVWLKDADCPTNPAASTWREALDFVASLNTGSITCADYTPGTFTDWRLPNIKHLLSLVDYGQGGPALASGHPFVNVQSAAAAVSGRYWSSSSLVSLPSGASTIRMFTGEAADGNKSSCCFSVWPVRVAQTAISAEGVVESTPGGLKFPDGTVQTTAAEARSAPVEVTGLTGCWDTDGIPRTCAGTGEDGESQAGVAWPTPRFTDNGDGTVTDNLTGLVWLQDAHCVSGSPLWQGALDWVASFNGGTTACTNYTPMTFTDWRLPNIKELLSLADYSQVTNPALAPGHPFIDVGFAGSYWSSSSRLGMGVWIFSIEPGIFEHLADKKSTNDIWPVRGGQ
jgi:hypothetical protein